MKSENRTHKKNLGNQPKGKKSVIINNATADIGLEGGEETEVAAQVILSAEGPWAWVVLAASFCCLFIIDGCAFSYGALLPDIVNTLQIDSSLGALISAIELSVYFLFSPISSALINRFGFRTSCMTGSMISSVGLLGSYFCKNVESLIVFLGIVTGIGISIVNLSASLIVGFYFEKRRGLAVALSTGGSSVGTMIMYQVNNVLVKSSGWENTLLMHSGLHGFVYFLSLVFRPLLSLTIAETEEEGNPTRTVTILPTFANQPGKPSDKQGKATATERMLHAVSSKRFPTASAFFQEGDITTQGSPSTSTRRVSIGVSKLTLKSQGVVNKAQMKQVQSMVSRMQVQEGKSITTPEVTVQVKEESPKSFFGRLFNWQADTPESRPMYRDDAFYEGEVKNLPVYQKSVAALKESERTGLEYQLAVTRAIRADDLYERRGICTISLRRVLVSMMDPSLLKRKSVLLICFAGMFTFSGFVVPYVFLQDRNSEAGVDQHHCSLFVSVISFSSLIGRLVFGMLTNYIDGCHVMSFGLCVAGIATILSDLSYSLAYQYMYSVVYGFFVSVITGCRSIVLVKLYGLENLTNLTGMILMFIGIGNLMSTPVAAFIKGRFGYKYAFYVAGGFITLAGIAFIPVNALNARENKVNTDKQTKNKS